MVYRQIFQSMALPCISGSLATYVRPSEVVQAGVFLLELQEIIWRFLLAESLYWKMSLQTMASWSKDKLIVRLLTRNNSHLLGSRPGQEFAEIAAKSMIFPKVHLQKVLQDILSMLGLLTFSFQPEKIEESVESLIVWLSFAK